MNKFARAVVRTTLCAASAYCGYAAFTYFRYGRNKSKPLPSPLDRFIPEPETAEIHSIDVHAPANVAYDACANYDMSQSPIAEFLFDVRAVLLGATPEPVKPTPLLEAFREVGWAVLDETPGREIVFGGVAQPWLADAGFRPIAAGDFRDFNEPGGVKIVFTLAVQPAGDSSSVVLTETRVSTTDADARRRFRKYWALVRPGVKLIRLVLLRGIKAKAEAAASAAAA